MAVGAVGVVVHTGSYVTEGGRDTAMRQVREALLPMLDVLPDAAPDLMVAGGALVVAAMYLSELGPRHSRDAEVTHLVT
jgi:deoxyribonuclease-4